MHQTIQEPATRHAASMDVPDPAQYATLIHLGPIEAPRHLDLALQALNKLLRCAEGSARLLMAESNRGTWENSLLPPHCSLFSASELRRALRHCDASVLAPAFSDPQGTLTLHALASGVPLGALNLATLSRQARAALPLHGHALLAVSRTRSRTH